MAVLRRRAALAVTLSVIAVAGARSWWRLQVRRVLGAHITGSRAPRASLQATRASDAFHLPPPTPPGIVALGALVAGLVAVAAGPWAALPRVVSSSPPAVLLVWSAVLLPPPGRCRRPAPRGCGFLVVGGGRVQSGGPVPGRAASLSTGPGRAALSWTAAAGSEAVRPAAAVVAEVPPVGAALATDLTGVEPHDATVVLFRATTPGPHLLAGHLADHLLGNRWVPDPATSALLAGGHRSRVRGACRSTHFHRGRSLSPYVVGSSAPPSTVAASGSPSPVVTPSGVVATSVASGSQPT